jgi:hypothetical protein
MLYTFHPSAIYDPQQIFPPGFQLELNVTPELLRQKLKEKQLLNDYFDGENKCEVCIYAEHDDKGNERSIAIINAIYAEITEQARLCQCGSGFPASWCGEQSIYCG